VQREPVYWLHAHRYTDSMTLTQALRENMGDPQKRRIAILSSLRKSDRTIVVLKRCNERGAKGLGHLG